MHVRCCPRAQTVRREIRPPRIAAFTATATPEVRDDIAVQLGITGASLHVRGFDRPNLYYSVVASGGTADKTQKLASEPMAYGGTQRSEFVVRGR